MVKPKMVEIEMQAEPNSSLKTGDEFFFLEKDGSNLAPGNIAILTDEEEDGIAYTIRVMVTEEAGKFKKGKVVDLPNLEFPDRSIFKYAIKV